MSKKFKYAGDRAREYKSSKIFIIDKIDYSRVIATRSYDASIKNILRELIRLLLFDYDFSYEENKESILVAYSYLGKGRKDFDTIINMFDACINNKADRINFIYKIKLNFLFKKIGKLISLYFRFLFSKISNPFFAAILTAQFVHYKKYIEEIYNNKNYKLLISFCDAHGIENMTTQIAQNRHITTATLQHGQYRVLKKQKENADIESYENFISDYLLAWGQKTKEEFGKAGINPKRILSVGALKNFSNNNRLPIHKELKVFGVVLDGNIYHYSNVKIIKYANYLAERYNLKYILRLHPKNSLNKYIPLCDKRYFLKNIKNIENKEYAEMVDFSLVHMTSVFVELLSINSPIFLMKDDCLEDIFTIEGMYFENENDIDKIYESFKLNPQKFSNEQYKLYRKFNESGNINENYKMAIKKILEE